MTLDSLTSGFNIAKNISMNPRVNAMAGFTEAETRKVLGELGIADWDAVLNRLTAYYNGYVFCHDPKQAERILNSNPVMYFLDEYTALGEVRQMADVNIKSDYGKQGNGAVYDVVLETPNAVIRDVYYKYYADYLRLEKTEKRDE